MFSLLYYPHILSHPSPFVKHYFSVFSERNCSLSVRYRNTCHPERNEMDSRDLRIFVTFKVKSARRSFDSRVLLCDCHRQSQYFKIATLCSLRMTLLVDGAINDYLNLISIAGLEYLMIIPATMVQKSPTMVPGVLVNADRTSRGIRCFRASSTQRSWRTCAPPLMRVSISS